MVFLVILGEQLFIGNFREVNIQVNGVVKRQSQQHSNEFEPQRQFVRMPIEPVEAVVVLRQEHIEVGVEDSLGNQRKIFIFDSSFISSLLSDERNPKWTFQALLDSSQFFERVVEDVVSVDGKAEIDESFDGEVALEVHILHHGVEAHLHLLADAHFLLVDRLDLHEFVLVAKL
jgi:hypothetical protein